MNILAYGYLASVKDVNYAFEAGNNAFLRRYCNLYRNPLI